MSVINSGTTALFAGNIYVSAVLVVVVLALSVIVFVNNRKIAALNERYNTFMRGKNGHGVSLERLLEECLDEIQELRGANQTVKLRLSSVEKKQKISFQKMGVVRYNPFEDTGGDLSYAIALLDDTNTGFIINGIYSRSGSYTYAKEIENGVSEKYKLSPEELEALQRAIKSNDEGRYGRD